MSISRRTIITSVVAGSALAAVPSTAALAASPPGDVVGKMSVGYQGWFACIGDGSPLNGWWHWAQNWGQTPSPSNNAIISWPDVREYTRTFPTAFQNLGNGQPAALFSQYDQQTIDTHFKWMRDHNIDTAALQRFNPTGGEGPIRDAITPKVRAAAEAFGRKFYIMYDVTNWLEMQSQIKTDWTTKMSANTSSPAYARQNGKPVVCIWGFGFNDGGRPFAPAPCLEVINWFKAQGCYVIGGVPTYWRQGINDSRPGFFDVYTAFNMISPWMVGRTGTLEGLDWFYTNVNVPDQAECNSRGIDYQPCVMPGDLSQRVRRHGDFYWRHIYNMVRVGAQGLYVSMFDEYNEGNQIAKTAETQAQIPVGTSFVTTDEDGTFCSADYYLRITADGGRMLKGQIPLTPTRPTPPVAGGDTVPPTAPSNLATTAKTATSVSLAWAAATDNVGVTGYQVRQGGNVVATVTGLSHTVNGLSPSTQYSFTVTALDALNNVSPPSNTVTVTTDAPGTGDNLALNKPASASSQQQNYGAANAVDGNANTYWESANNAFPQWIQVDLGAAYSVNRLVLKLPTTWGPRTQTLSVLDGSNQAVVVGPAGYSFAPNVTITFPARSMRYARIQFTGNTGWPAAQLSELEVYASTGGGDTQPPTAPSNLTMTAKTSSSASLSWGASTDNVGVTGYQVRQGGNVVATVTGLSHTVTGLSPSTQYSFTVTAIDAANNVSPASNTAVVTTDAVPTANLALNKPATASSQTQTYAPANVVDGNANTYWESANNAFPQWIQVDLGAAMSVSRLVLKLPASWGPRTQTIAVLDGSNQAVISAAAGRAFSPNATITFPARSVRYVRLQFTANTGWPAGQLSELEAYAS